MKETMTSKNIQLQVKAGPKGNFTHTLASSSLFIEVKKDNRIYRSAKYKPAEDEECSLLSFSFEAELPLNKSQKIEISLFLENF